MTTHQALSTLGLRLPCSVDQAKRAFRVQAMSAHPDHGGTDEKFREIREAIDVLQVALEGGGPEDGERIEVKDGEIRWAMTVEGEGRRKTVKIRFATGSSGMRPGTLADAFEAGLKELLGADEGKLEFESGRPRRIN